VPSKPKPIFVHNGLIPAHSRPLAALTQPCQEVGSPESRGILVDAIPYSCHRQQSIKRCLAENGNKLAVRIFDDYPSTTMHRSPNLLTDQHQLPDVLQDPLKAHLAQLVHGYVEHGCVHTVAISCFTKVSLEAQYCTATKIVSGY
jgi:hypothetical protein